MYCGKTNFDKIYTWQPTSKNVGSKINQQQ